MSQKKVDAYKAAKANRKEILKKEKRMRRIEQILGSAICIALIVWVGFSVYSKATAVDENLQLDTPINTTALDDYMTSVDAEIDEAEAAADADAEVVEEAEELTEEVTGTAEAAEEAAGTAEAAEEEIEAEEKAAEETETAEAEETEAVEEAEDTGARE